MTSHPFFRTLRTLGLATVVSVAGAVVLTAGETGKVAGRIIDADSRQPLIGVNVVVQGTFRGAVTDEDGFYIINNVLPGTYEVVASMLGYGRTTVTGVIVKIDLTTRVDISLQQEAIQGQEVVVRAERPLVQKDLTSTSVTVSSEDLKLIPTESIVQVVNLQAGVVGGHFRGGRSNEVAYLIDGVSMTDPFNGQISLQVENSSVRAMKVISGTFNAEYGQAMSGIVNIVTQEGSPEYHGGFSMYGGDYVSAHDDVFPNLGSLTSMRIRNLQGSLSGPVPFLGRLSFFVTGRMYEDQGYLYGRRIYRVTDTSPYLLRDPQGNTILDPAGNPIYIVPRSGDSAFVPMNPSERSSFNAKVTYGIEGWKFNYSFFWDDNWNKYYDHGFAWTPDGITNHYRTNWIHALQVTHAPSPSTFQSVKLSYNQFRYKGYLYEDPYDPRYVDPNQGTPISGYTFRSGGNHGDRYRRYSNSIIGQWSLTSQLTQRHEIGIGVEGRLHEIFNHWTTIMNRNTVETDSTGALLFVIGYPQSGTLENQEYLRKPYEVSAYLQDKIEFDAFIINAGVRVDYFEPNASYPYDLRNPGNNPLFPNANRRKRATPKLQVSPRLGVSFPITDEGIIHFSYGHFFQIPSFENLYVNSAYLVRPGGSLSSILGNPDLDAQRTVMYELGLQQVFFGIIGMDLTVYYRDIRSLLGMEIINTYEGFKYARFINRDYGNVKGFILSFDKRLSNLFGVGIDYTYQLASGNASDPYSVYYNNQSDPPVETNKKTVPLNWDQRSTLNLSLTIGEPGDWTVGTVFQYGSGFPYTEDIRVSNGLRFENGGTKPTTFSVDLRAEKVLRLGGVNVQAFVLIYNVLDRKNEVNVDAASGRTNVDLFTYLAGPIIGLNSLDQYVNNPANYSAPRQVRIGFAVDF